MCKYYFSLFFLILIGIFPQFAFAQVEIPDETIVDYSAIDKSLREVLFELSQEANVPISFQEEILPGDSLINFSVRQQPLGVVVDYLLERHHVKYKLVGEQIVLYKDLYYNSKKEITISGTLSDLLSGETLVSANVYLYDKSKGTTSNEYGFYSFTLPKGQNRIHFSYLGYNTEVIEVALKKDTVINIKLDPNNLLNEVVITESRIIIENEEEYKTEQVDFLSLEKLNSILSVGGEPDVMRLAFTNTGVTSGADGFGGMSVRGGSTNQNLILYDGIPVYNANHLFGIYSIFNTNVIKSAKLYKGAFPSHYSGRLSSVLDIRTREGNNQKFGGDISISLLTAKVSLEGPIKIGNSSFLISARRTTVDPWINSLNNILNTNSLSDRETKIKFYDINAKLNFSLSEKSKLYLSYYKGDDIFNNKIIEKDSDQTLSETNELNWNSGNTLASIKWNSTLSAKSFLNTTLYYSKNTYNSFDHDRLEQLNGETFISANYDAGYYESIITDLGAKIELDLVPSPKHKLKIGAGFISHKFSPQFFYTTEADSLTIPEIAIKEDDILDELKPFNLTGTELEFFIEDKISFGKNSELNIGLNQLLVNSGKLFIIPQPRILFSKWTDRYKLSMSWGMMGQFLHSLSNTGLGVPTDIWIPSTKNIVPEKAWTGTIGQQLTTKKGDLIGLEVYYKKLTNVTRYGTGILKIADDLDWESSIPIGKGESYGAELNYKKTQGRNILDLAYTISWTNRQFDALIDGEKFRFRYDRRHVININFLHRFNENIEFTGNWEFGSGTPISLPSLEQYLYTDDEGNETVVRVNEDINNDELPAYHRLDLGFNLYSKYNWGRSKLTLGVYNVYNRINPLYIDLIINPDKTTSYEQFYLFSFMPSISYNISF